MWRQGIIGTTRGIAKRAGRWAWASLGVAAVAAVGGTMQARRKARDHPLLRQMAAVGGLGGEGGSDGGRENKAPTQLAIGPIARLIGAAPSDATRAIPKAMFPAEWPFSVADFSRHDESPDSSFYASPRLVHHIDDPARAALTRSVFGRQPATTSPSLLNARISLASGLGLPRMVGVFFWAPP